MHVIVISELGCIDFAYLLEFNIRQQTCFELVRWMHVGASCVPAVCVVREFVQTACSAGVLMKISVFGLKSEIFTCTARVSGCCSLSRDEGVDCCAECMGACCVKAGCVVLRPCVYY